MFNLIKKTNILEKIHQYLLDKKSVLVCCGQGSQRSCAIVVCYLIKYFGNVNFINTIQMIYQENNLNL
jgi:protein-tyrosine phosphatase